MLIDKDRRHWMDGGFGAAARGGPMLFLDRDGVLVEEVNYLARASDVRLTPGIGPALAAVNRAGVPVAVVTNQSGIGRGMFGWDAFLEVEAEIAAQLGRHGARLDAVLACGADPNGPPSEAADPWRKPAPGMIEQARLLIDPDPRLSFIVGDRVSDLEAGRRGRLAGGWLVATGYGASQATTPAFSALLSGSDAFCVRQAANAAVAVAAFLAIVAA